MTLQYFDHVNNSLFASKMENIIQYMYEDELQKDISIIFQQMLEEILDNLNTYYGDVLLNAHLDLILSPIHEHHKEYHNTILKYKNREYRKGKTQARRLVKRAKKYAKNYSKYHLGAVKANTEKIPIKPIIKKDELFGTSDYSANHMRDKTFVASERTLNRVDNDINNIITKGYREGQGIKQVGKDIEKRFNQLKKWEAKRIARTEIHGSHNLGMMKAYEEMGVEYTQWMAAKDNRTRDSHRKLDGEIIPFGGVYSNDLRYPGDTSGSLSEFINCRCTHGPYFIPQGYIAPSGMSNFRESDLVVTLDKWSNEDLLKEYQQDNVDKVLNQLETRSDKWDIYRLTPEEKIELNSLRSKEKLGFLDRRRLKELEHKEMFNRLNNKYITEGKLSFDEAKDFRSLQNSMKLSGFYDGELTSLEKLQGIETKPKNIFNTVKPREPSKWDKNIESIKESSHSTVNNRKFINKTNQSQEAIDSLVEKQKLIGEDKELALTWSGDANISMNQHINGGEIDLKYGSYRSVDELKNDVDNLINLIDSMPKNKCISEDTLLFRGITDDRIDLNMFVPNSEPKKLNSFTSTSYNVDTADTFAQYTDIDGAQGWILKIHAPKGTKGVAINREVGNAGEEYEYLLSPNQKYITHNVDEKNKIIDIELVN